MPRHGVPIAVIIVHPECIWIVQDRNH